MMNESPTMSRRGSSNVSQKAEPLSLDSSDDAVKTRDYPKPSDLPIGPSLFPELWRADPSATPLKVLYVCLGLVGFTGLLFLSPFLRYAFPNIDHQWDQRNGILSNQSGLLALPTLIRKVLHIHPDTVRVLFQATGAVCVALIVVDILLGLSATSKTSPWPRSWKTDNTLCYHDMFSEPTRFGRLLRRPGNTLSNAPYLLGSLCVLASVTAPNGIHRNIFWMADAEFGVMLFFLVVTSMLWHGSNAPWSQYVDIWSMDCCIAYLIIRNTSVAVLFIVLRYLGTSPDFAQRLMGGICAILYAAVIVAVGRDKWSWYQRGYLNRGCPFSVRARLLGMSDVLGRGQVDVGVGAAVAYACMPVIFFSVPLMMEIFVMRTIGSTMAGDLLASTLVIGWNYRMLDRWVLDGNAWMNYFVRLEPSLYRTVGAAIFSPTAVLHAFTGITLLAGYVHSRTLEHCLEIVKTNISA